MVYWQIDYLEILIYQRDYTRKREKVYSYKVKDRTIFTTYNN